MRYAVNVIAGYLRAVNDSMGKSWQDAITKHGLKSKQALHLKSAYEEFKESSPMVQIGYYDDTDHLFAVPSNVRYDYAKDQLSLRMHS